MDREYFLSTLLNSKFDCTNSADGRHRLKVMKEHQLLNSEKSDSVADFLGFINVSLGSSRTRLSGLLDLHSLLEQCHGSILQQNSASWSRTLLTVLQSRDPSDTKRLAMNVTEALITSIQSFPELTRDFTSSSLSVLMTTLLTAEAAWKQEAVKCICTCMKFFPGGCLSFKIKIEQLVLSDMDSADSGTRKLSMRVYSALPLLGGAGSGGVKHSDNWTYYIDRLISSLHSTIDLLYTGVETDESYSRPTTGVKYWNDKALGVHRYGILTQRVSTLMQGIKYMLRSEIKTAVPAPVRSILLIVQRIVAVTPKTLMTKPTTERTLLASIQPLLYKLALSLTTSLIYSVTSHMIPYASVINKCFMQVLTSTQTSAVSFGVAKPYGNTRMAVYRCIRVWLESLGAKTGLECQADNLIQFIIDDITPQQDTIKSGESAQLAEVAQHMNQRHKKKGSKRAGSSFVGQISSQRKICLTANAQLCGEALKTMETLIGSCGPLLEDKHYNGLYKLVLPLAVSLQPTAKSVPYADASCRVALYKLIESMVVNCHQQVAAPVTCATALFTCGLQDTSHKVRKVCRDALIAIEMLAHPRAPTMHFPLPVPQKNQNGDQAPVETNGSSNVLPTYHSNESMPIAHTLDKRNITVTSLYKQNIDLENSMFDKAPCDSNDNDGLSMDISENELVASQKIDSQSADSQNIDSQSGDSHNIDSQSDSENGDSTNIDAQYTKVNICREATNGSGDATHNNDVTSKHAESDNSAGEDTSGKLVERDEVKSNSDLKRKLEHDTEDTQLNKKPYQEAEQADSDNDVTLLMADFVDSHPDDN